MEIEDAFTTEAIELAGTNLSEPEERLLHALTREVYMANELELETAQVEAMDNICLLYFVAGRTHQWARTRIPVSMTVTMHNRFLEFLDQELNKEASDG